LRMRVKAIIKELMILSMKRSLPFSKRWKSSRKFIRIIIMALRTQNLKYTTSSRQWTPLSRISYPLSKTGISRPSLLKMTYRHHQS
jgi:hypothetical protein